MLHLQRNKPVLVRTTRFFSASLCFRNYASLTGSIHRGAEKARNRSERIGSNHGRPYLSKEARSLQRPDRTDRPSQSQPFRQVGIRSERLGSNDSRAHPTKNPRSPTRSDRRASPNRPDRRDRPPHSQPFRQHTPTPEHSKFAHPGEQKERNDISSDESASSDKHTVFRGNSVPLSIPRTSAASEFIYGFSAVRAAVQAKRRRLYKLYVSEASDEVVPREGHDSLLRSARDLHLRVQTMRDDGLRLLSKMSQGRPHNGYVLEASQMPTWPVEALDEIPQISAPFWFTTGHQSAEEIAITGTSPKLPGNPHRYPLVLLLDNILDPGNLGAIIRSATFFGVDAVALIDHNLAPFSPVSLKASSGAAEFMPFLKVKKDIDFIKRSQQNGWKVVAAVAPGSPSSRGSFNTKSIENAAGILADNPCILLIGGEGTGLRPRLQKTADRVIGISPAPSVRAEMGLDSLNASVAAAIMVQTLVQGHNTPSKPTSAVQEASSSQDRARVF